MLRQVLWVWPNVFLPTAGQLPGFVSFRATLLISRLRPQQTSSHWIAWCAATRLRRSPGASCRERAKNVGTELSQGAVVCATTSRDRKHRSPPHTKYVQDICPSRGGDD